MSQPVYHINFLKQKGPNEPPGYHHRVKNFAEDLLREVELTGMGRLNDIDQFFERLTITLDRRKDLATVRQLIRQNAKRHNLETDIELQRE